MPSLAKAWDLFDQHLLAQKLYEPDGHDHRTDPILKPFHRNMASPVRFQILKS